MDEEARIELELRKIDEMRGRRAKAEEKPQAQQKPSRDVIEEPIGYDSQFGSVSFGSQQADYAFFRKRAYEADSHQVLVQLLSSYKEQAQQCQQARDATLQTLNGVINKATDFIQQRAAMGRVLEAVTQLQAAQFREVGQMINGKEHQYSAAFMLACNEIEQLDIQIAQIEAENLDIQDSIQMQSEQLVLLRNQASYVVPDGSKKRIVALQDQLRQLVEVRDQLASELEEIIE